MKIRTLLLAMTCLIIFSGIADAKSKKTAKKAKTESEQTQLKSTPVKKTKPRMCYTHTRKWHECAYQPKQ